MPDTRRFRQAVIAEVQRTKERNMNFIPAPPVPAVDEPIFDSHPFGVNTRYRSSGPLLVAYHVERPEALTLVVGLGDEATANFFAEALEYHAHH